jgi:hypothetical protein
MGMRGSHSCLAARPSTERGRILAVVFSVLLNVMFLNVMCMPGSHIVTDTRSDSSEGVFRVSKVSPLVLQREHQKRLYCQRLYSVVNLIRVPYRCPKIMQSACCSETVSVVCVSVSRTEPQNR